MTVRPVLYLRMPPGERLPSTPSQVDAVVWLPVEFFQAGAWYAAHLAMYVADAFELAELIRRTVRLPPMPREDSTTTSELPRVIDPERER